MGAVLLALIVICLSFLLEGALGAAERQLLVQEGRLHIPKAETTVESPTSCKTTT